MFGNDIDKYFQNCHGFFYCVFVLKCANFRTYLMHQIQIDKGSAIAIRTLMIQN